MAFWDVSRAHFYGHARRRIFARLPDEDYTEGKVALLQRSWYGTQDAASIWQDDYAGLLAEHGYVAGSRTQLSFGVAIKIREYWSMEMIPYAWATPRL